MRLAFIDLETSGLPKTISFDEYHDYRHLQHYENARIVQIALLVYDLDERALTLTHVNTHVYVIKPDQFEIRNSHIHRISNAMADFAGITMIDMAKQISNDLLSSDVLIAHNILFDRNVLLSELHRYKIDPLIYKINSMKYFCTSKGCSHITKIRYNAHKYKQPKLSELYKFVFDEELQDAHDALVDTQALVKCFGRLIKDKKINIADFRR